jgi:hypothetical protein
LLKLKNTGKEEHIQRGKAMSLKWIAVLGVWLLAAQVSAQETPALKTQKDKVSYSVGVEVAKNFKDIDNQ